MQTMGAVEKTTRYAASVEDLPAAWAFVMEMLEKVGPDPSIKISPVWVVSLDSSTDETDKPPRHFSVVVEGMVEEQADAVEE